MQQYRVLVKSDVNAVLWDSSYPSLPILLEDAGAAMAALAVGEARRKFRIEISERAYDPDRD